MPFMPEKSSVGKGSGDQQSPAANSWSSDSRTHIMQFIENIIANLWNRLTRLFKRKLTGGLSLGRIVVDGRISKLTFFLPQLKRAEHLVVLGKTGQGKSFLILFLCLQDICSERGFVIFDPHGSLIPLILQAIAFEERRTGKDLSSKVIVIEPANQVWSVGFNPLEAGKGQHSFVSIIGLTAIIKERWGLAHFGPQTEEILRNSLHVLADNGLTIIELSSLLSNSAFRLKCLKRVSNPEVKDYFENRFEPMSEAMKATVRNPILNKTSEFASDPHFRHILGQQHSTFSILDAMDTGKMVLVDLNKGLLGKHSATLGSLLMAQISSSIFVRKSRSVYSLYLDEIQNLLTADSDLDVLLAEARKFGVSIVSANQYLDQFPKNMRSAVQAVGTHIAFQLSNDDATTVSAMLDGGKPLAELLKNLPKKTFVVKSGHYPWKQVEVPEVRLEKVDFHHLLERSRKVYARLRDEVETEIQSRRPKQKQTVEEVLDAWE
jgi:Helicase HerA, central domain